MTLQLPTHPSAEFWEVNDQDEFVFRIKSPLPGDDTLAVHLGDRDGWEYACASSQRRCPAWEEMCFVKSLLWEPEDCVVQFHPPESQYVNVHPYCLWLFRPIDGGMPRPPTHIVGTPHASPAFIAKVRKWAGIGIK